MSIFSSFFHALHDLVSHGEGRAESEALSLVREVEQEVDAKIDAALRPLVDRLDKMEASLTGNPLIPTPPAASPPATA